MKLNWTELKKDIAAVTSKILIVKKFKRESGQPSWNRNLTTPEGLRLEDWALDALKSEATGLCAIAAHARGHVHFHGMKLEEQAEYIGSTIDAYLIKDAA